jgi:opacity protein-like surface antigen
VGESSVVFGPKVEKRLGRVSPYANFLLGYGMFTFTHPVSAYTHDNSVVYDFGGGVDVAVTRSLSLKGDLQYQSWQLGSEDNRMMPVAVSVGVTYHIRSKPHWGSE